MATQEQELKVAKALVTFLRETSPITPDNIEPTIPPSCRIEVNQSVEAADSTTGGKSTLSRAVTSDWPRVKAVWTLAASPPLAMKEEHPKDAEIVRRLQVLAEERS